MGGAGRRYARLDLGWRCWSWMLRAAAMWLCVLSPRGTARGCSIPLSQYNALQALYDATSGPSWCLQGHEVAWHFSLTAVNTSAPCEAHWVGVTCSCAAPGSERNSTVSKLQLPILCLSGSLPSSISALSDLTSLDLSNPSYFGLYQNVLTGTIPSAIGSLFNLTVLRLKYNLFTGPVPASLGQLLVLEHLDLSNNALSQSIPQRMFDATALQYLDLSNNALTGSISSEIGQCLKLQVANLYSMRLTGSIPEQLYEATALQQLRLDINMLSGSISARVSQLTQLEQWVINNNNLWGSLPTSIGQLTAILKLVMDINSLSGSLPSSLSTMVSVEEISMSENELIGEIPSGLSQLTALQVLNLGDNQLSGTLPTDLFTAESPLRALLLESNSIHGTIPSTIGLLSAMQYIVLGYNQLSGSLPVEIYNLTALSDLIIADNHLSGSLPDSLARLSSLISFYGFQNRFTGTVPDCFFTSKLLTLSLAGNSLVGTVPLAVSRAKALQSIDLGTNYLTGTIPSSLFLLSSISSVALDDNSLVGSIPSTLQNASILNVLYLHANQLTGSIPAQLSALQYLVEMETSVNQLTGTIPEALSQLPRLDTIQLFSNMLTGTLSAALMSSTALFTLYIGANHLTGSFPSSLRNWTVASFSIYGNSLTGSLPPYIFESEALQELIIYDNEFTGTIPSTVSAASYLQYLSISSNQLTGSIPSDLMTMTSVAYLDLSINRITGTMSALFVQYAQWRYISLSSNLLTGSIPDALFTPSAIGFVLVDDNLLTSSLPTMLQTATKLQQLSVSANMMTGPLPDMSELTLLVAIVAFSNRLTGTVPTSLGSLSWLSYLLVNDNYLSGTFFPLFNARIQSRLQLVNCADNLLSGSIAPSFFQLRNLSVLSASGNCFTGFIPQSVCDGSAMMSVLDMDSMGGNSGCIPNANLNDARPLFVNGLFSRLGLQGMIPDCLADFTALTTLHLSGNLLKGSIPSFGQINGSRALVDLALSNNALTGSIPASLQLHAFTALDLSNNRLDGTLEAGFVLSPAQTTLGLAVNRLSGSLPTALQGLSSASGTNLTSFNVLTSNIFACSAKEIPELDAHSQSYSCGSYELEVAAYLWLAVATGVSIVVLCMWLAVRYNRRLTTIGGTVAAASSLLAASRDAALIWMRAIDSCLQPVSTASIRDKSRVYPQTRTFLMILRVIRRWACLMGVLLAVVVLPVYVGLSGVASIVSDDYGFEPSVTFLHGLAPMLFVAVLVLALLTMLTVAGYAFDRRLLDPTLSTSSTAVATAAEATMTSSAPEESSDWNRRSRGYALLCAAHTVSVVVTLAVNAAYVNAILNSDLSRTQLLAIQAAVGVFKLVWNGLYIPWSARLLSHFLRHASAMRSRLIMSLMNFIIAPCVATIAVNQACFYFAFNSLPPVQSTVRLSIESTYISCETGQCYPTITESYVSFSTSAVPSFGYSYACGSALLEAYIPVLLYSYVTYCFVVPLLRIWQLVMGSDWRSMLQCLDRDSSLDRVAGRSVVVGLTVHAIILLTFGVASPVLGLCVVIGMVADCALSELLTGRLLCRHNKATRTAVVAASDVIHVNPLHITKVSEITSVHADVEGNENDKNKNEAVLRVTEKDDMTDAWPGLRACSTLIVVTVSVFWSLLFFDMVADSYGIDTGIGVSVAFVATAPAVAWLAPRLYMSAIPRTERLKEEEEDAQNRTDETTTAIKAIDASKTIEINSDFQNRASTDAIDSIHE